MLGTAALAAAALASTVAGPPDDNTFSGSRCGFGPDERVVYERRGIGCAEAKQVLLRLRGTRDTIPMVCGRPKDLHGWRLTPAKRYERSWSLVTTRYSRGNVSFEYGRMQSSWRVWCPQPPEFRLDDSVG
jgi:hypothetical protein